MTSEISTPPTAENECTTNVDSLHKNVEIASAEVRSIDFLYGDKWNLVKLLFLYVLQGVPLGFAEAFPIILKTRQFSYYDQAIFSTSTWPFTMKILWAPLVDSVYCSAVGRRKMWLVPVQILLGAFLLFSSVYNDHLLTSTEENSKIIPLTIIWTIINCLAATQDIVVDGWACSMLQKQNIHYASTCNGTGQSLGSFLGFVVPLLLGSETFCNKWLRIRQGSGGLVTFKGCLYFWGIVYIIAATCVCMFKSETQPSSKQKHLGVWNTYRLLWAITKLPNIRILGAIILTAKVGFATIDTATNMEFMEAGVSKHSIVIIGMLLYLVKVIVPITLTATTNSTTALDLYIKYVPHRFLHGLAFSLLLYYAPALLNHVSAVQTCFYVVLGLTYVTNQACMYVMYVSYISFITGISDPNFGGTYMTLLGTFANVSIAVTRTISLWFIDVLTFQQCSNDPDQNHCITPALAKSCEATGGMCNTIISGYYAEIAISTVLGIAWYFTIKKPIGKLQSSDKKNWLISEEQNLVMETI